VTIEHLDPDLVAAVDASGQVYKRTPVRYDRTMEYFTSWITADSQTVIRMSDILMKVHDRSYGVNPVTGNNFEANKPESQLWIHVTAWHSILYTYETFGPGKLSRDEENEYWSQMVTAAAAQPIRQEDVPRTRGEVQKYLDDWREKLSASEAAIRNVDVILDGFENIEPDLPKWLQKLGRPLLRKSIIATYPRWMRPMLGVKQSRVMDTLAIAAWKPIYKRPGREPQAVPLAHCPYLPPGTALLRARPPRDSGPEHPASSAPRSPDACTATRSPRWSSARSCCGSGRKGPARRPTVTTTPTRSSSSGRRTRPTPPRRSSPRTAYKIG
jgi:uncharacterized protein (DUF2236 family)